MNWSKPSRTQPSRGRRRVFPGRPPGDVPLPACVAPRATLTHPRRCDNSSRSAKMPMAVSGPSPMRANLHSGWDGSAASGLARVPITTDSIGAGSAEPASTGVVVTVGLLSPVATGARELRSARGFERDVGIGVDGRALRHRLMSTGCVGRRTGRSWDAPSRPWLNELDCSTVSGGVKRWLREARGSG
jgi:hypothetical protein